MRKIFLPLSILLLSSLAFTQRLADNVPSQWRIYVLEAEGALCQEVLKGDSVNVLAYFTVRLKSTQKEEGMVFTLLQNVGVLDVLKVGGECAFAIKVDPRDAQYLFLAEKETKLKVVLTPKGYNFISPFPPVSATTVLGGGVL